MTPQQQHFLVGGQVLVAHVTARDVFSLLMVGRRTVLDRPTRQLVENARGETVGRVRRLGAQSLEQIFEGACPKVAGRDTSAPTPASARAPARARALAWASPGEDADPDPAEETLGPLREEELADEGGVAIGGGGGVVVTRGGSGRGVGVGRGGGGTGGGTHEELEESIGGRGEKGEADRKSVV